MAGGNPWVLSPQNDVPTSVSTPMRMPSMVPAWGPVAPQSGVPSPDRVDQLPVHDHRSGAALWWLGVHGGSGETTLAELVPEWQAADHKWPRVPGVELSRVVLTTRSSARGLRAAQVAATQWASGLVPFVDLLGLVIVADAPGRLPRPLRDLARVVAGGFPRTWELPWDEGWRLGEQPLLQGSTRPVQRLIDDLSALVRAGSASTVNN